MGLVYLNPKPQTLNPETLVSHSGALLQASGGVLPGGRRSALAATSRDLGILCKAWGLGLI